MTRQALFPQYSVPFDIVPHDLSTYLVASESDASDWYLVDLEGQDEYGATTCTCQAFIITGLECKHIALARDYESSNF